MAAHLSFDGTLGALFVGFSVSTVIYGMFLIQCLNYFIRYPLDKTGYKAIVALLLVLDTLHQIFLAHAVYYYSVTNYLNILALVGKPIWSLVFQLLIGAVVGSIVKFLFALRVWRFSYGNWWLTTLLLFLDVGQLALAIVFTVKSYALGSLTELESLRPIGVAALALGVVNDIGIAISLCYYLQTMRSSYTQTNSVIRNLTIYAVSTGILTSATSFTTVIIVWVAYFNLYNFIPRSLIFVSFYFVLSKLYGVSFVAALNTRQLKPGGHTTDEPKKSASLCIVMDKRSRSLNAPADIRTITRHSRDVESRAGEENDVTASTHHTEDSEKRNKPRYAAGW